MSFVRWLFEKRLKYRCSKRTPVFPRYDDIKSVLILIDSISQDVNNLFFTDRKQVTCLTPPTSQQTSFFTKQPTKEYMQTVLTRKYDLLVDLTNDQSVSTQYVSLLCPAPFKCGVYVKEGLFDMTLTNASTPLEQVQEIIHYLKTINK